MLAPLEERLRLCSEETLTTLRQILDNITANPWEEKFRLLYAIKPKIRNMLSCPGCAQLLLERAGFLRRERRSSDQKENDLPLSSVLQLEAVPTPNWAYDEGEPFSTLAILVLPLDSCIERVHTARVTVNSCIQEKVPKSHNKVADSNKSTGRSANASADKLMRDNIKAQIKENQERLHDRNWFKNSEANQITTGSRVTITVSHGK